MPLILARVMPSCMAVVLFIRQFASFDIQLCRKEWNAIGLSCKTELKIPLSHPDTCFPFPYVLHYFKSLNIYLEKTVPSSPCVILCVMSLESSQWAVTVSSAGISPTGQWGMLNGEENSVERHRGGSVLHQACGCRKTLDGSFHPVLEVFSNSATLNTSGLWYHRQLTASTP